MRISAIIFICLASINVCFNTSNAQKSIAPNSPKALEHDEFMQSFLKSLPKKLATQARYEHGKLTIKSAPWDSSSCLLGLGLTGIGMLALVAALVSSCSSSQGLENAGQLGASGFFLAVLGFIIAAKNTPPDNCDLSFDAHGLSLNGKRQFTWNQVDDMAMDTITLCSEYKKISEETTLKIFDRFRNNLLSLSTNMPLGVSLNNIVALIKHYREKTIKKT